MLVISSRQIAHLSRRKVRLKVLNFSLPQTKTRRKHYCSFWGWGIAFETCVPRTKHISAMANSNGPPSAYVRLRCASKPHCTSLVTHVRQSCRKTLPWIRIHGHEATLARHFRSPSWIGPPMIRKHLLRCNAIWRPVEQHALILKTDHKNLTYIKITLIVKPPLLTNV